MASTLVQGGGGAVRRPSVLRREVGQVRSDWTSALCFKVPETPLKLLAGRSLGSNLPSGATTPGQQKGLPSLTRQPGPSSRQADEQMLARYLDSEGDDTRALEWQVSSGLHDIIGLLCV